MTYPLVRELASDGIPVTVTCRVLKFSPQGYYQWLKKPCSKRDYDNARLTNALIDLHRDDPTFGYRFMADELELLDEFVGERRVWRLCSEMSIFSAFTKKGKSGKKPGAPVHDDLVQRNFSASRPNELWFTDITEHPTTWIPAVEATPDFQEGLQWCRHQTEKEGLRMFNTKLRSERSSSNV